MKKRIYWSVPFLAISLIFASFSSPNELPVLGGAASESSLSSAASGTKYSYSLLGRSYLYQAGILSAKAPDGSLLDIHETSAYLDIASGEYLFTYPSYVEHLKVYENKPTDSISYASLLPSQVDAGTSVVFPRATITSGIIRTNGAPNPGVYSSYWVELFQDGRLSKHLSSDELSSYTFSAPASYEIDYCYEDVFGDTMRFLNTLEVRDVPTILITSLPSEADIYQEVSLSGVYGYYQKSKYSLTKTALSPSGVSTSLANVFKPYETGTYTLTFEGTIGGNTLHKEWPIVVKNGAIGLFSQAAGIGDFRDGESYPSNVNSAQKSGIAFTSTEENASLYYNKIVDLSAVKGSLIEFTANQRSEDIAIKSVKVTLIDAYDANNSIAVLFKEHPQAYQYPKGNPNHANLDFIYGVYQSTEYGTTYDSRGNPLTETRNGEVVSVQYGFTAAWGQSLAPLTDSENSYVPANFSYDLSTNCLYSYINDKVNVKVADFSSNRFGFPGFSGNEVYLKIDIVSGKGDLLLSRLGGQALSAVDASSFSTNENILLGKSDLSSLPSGAVNYPYTIPTAYGSSPLFSSFSPKVSLSKDGVDKTSLLSADNIFTPTEAGSYDLTYSLINQFNQAVQKKGSFQILSSPTPIVASVTLPTSLKINDIFTIPEVVFSGGSGTITSSLSFKEGANEVAVSSGESFRLTGKNTYSLIVKAVDSIGFSFEKEYPLNVSSSVLVVDFSSFPEAIAVEESWTVLAPSRTDYSKQESDSAYHPSVKITLDGVSYSEGDSFKKDSAGDVAMVYLIAPNTSSQKKYTRTLRVIDESLDASDPSQFYKTNSNISSVKTISNGAEFTTTSGGDNIATIDLPYALSANSLHLDFSVLAGSSSCSSVDFVLTSLSGESLSLGFHDLHAISPNTPGIDLNGEATGVSASYSTMTYAVNDNNHPGEKYREFTYTYDGSSASLLDSSYVAVVKSGEWSDHLAFDQFLRGGCYLQIRLSGLSGTGSFVLERISNQSLSASALSKGDKTTPALAFENPVSSESYWSVGESYELSEAYAYDVFHSSTVLAMALSINGTSSFKNSSSKAMKLVFEQIGLYVVTYTASDPLGNKTTFYYTFHSLDTTAPSLSVSGTYESHYSLNSTVSILPAIVEDNYDLQEELVVAIILTRPDGYFEFPASGSNLVLKEKGNYTLSYVCVDSGANRASLTYSWVVD